MNTFQKLAQVSTLATAAFVSNASNAQESGYGSNSGRPVAQQYENSSTHYLNSNPNNDLQTAYFSTGNQSNSNFRSQVTSQSDVSPDAIRIGVGIQKLGSFIYSIFETIGYVSTFLAGLSLGALGIRYMDRIASGINNNNLDLAARGSIIKIRDHSGR